MTVRRIFFSVVALAALLGGAGCNDRNSIPTLAETDEPFYVQAMQLKKQGRESEALAAFLKVIEKRGARTAPESHLEAGAIYLYHVKDPLEAYHHFRKYLYLLPNSKEAVFVKGKVEDAKREFSRTLPGRPMEDRSVRMQTEDDLAKLRRENEELRAELATLRGGGATPINRVPRMITVPDEIVSARPAPQPAEVVESPLAIASPRNVPPPETRMAPPVQQPAPKAAAAPARPLNASGRTHTVAPKDTLFSISRRYGLKVDDLVAANRSTVPSASTTLRPGMVLKIP